MKRKTVYTDEPMEVGRILPNFLPPPDKLIFKEDVIKVTLSLSSRTVFFFKMEAAKRGVQYQRMIRRLLDAYVDAFSVTNAENDPPEKKAHRVEQSRAIYRKVSARQRKTAKR